ncbi:facilitated trehalose transporter Tret1-like [Amblyomma americanum]
MERGRRADAQVALKRLRPDASTVEGEIEAGSSSLLIGFATHSSQVIEAIYPKTPMPIMHYTLAVMVIVLQHFSGVDVIMEYATGPLLLHFGSPLQEEFILLAVIQLVTTAICAQLLDRTGHVRPLAVSATLCTVSMMVLGAVYFGASNPAYALNTTLGSYLNFGSKVVFSAAFSAGLGPASWVLAIELTPLRGRGFDFFGSVCAFYWASALAVVSLFARMGTDPLSLAVLSWFCGVVTFAGGVTAFAFAPDTAGISIESILMEGQGDRRKKSEVGDAASTTIAPRRDETEALGEREESIAPPRLGVLQAERGKAAVVDVAGGSVADDDDKPQQQARAPPGGMLLSEAVSSSHSAMASTPSIRRPGSSRHKERKL